MRFRGILRAATFLVCVYVLRSLLTRTPSTPSAVDQIQNSPLIAVYLNNAKSLQSRRSLGEQFHVSFERCQWKCTVTTNQSLLADSAAVVFESRQISANTLPDRRSSSPDQIFVFYALESPMFPGVSSNLKRVCNHYFNRTMTYRKDSDYHIPYDRFTMSNDRYNDSYLEEVIAQKSIDVLMVVSKCSTPGKRERFIRRLRKFLDIRIFGICARKICDSRCLNENIRKARFYLSLENSVCDEYITEKAFRMKQLVVPIVFRESDYVNVLPRGSFVSLDQFGSAESFSAFITHLSRNNTAYREFFNWTRDFGFRSINTKTSEFCKLCGEIHNSDRKKKSIENIWEWWVVTLPATVSELVVDMNGSSDMAAPFSSSRNHFGFLTASKPTHQFMQLSCCECGIEKPGCEELEIHIKIEHLNWLPFVCPLCQTARATDSLLREHIYSAHKKSNTSKFVYMDDSKAKQKLLAHMDNSLSAYCTSRMSQNGNGTSKSPLNGNDALFSEVSDTCNPRKRKPPKPVINNETGEVLFADEAQTSSESNGFSDMGSEGVDADCFGILSSVLAAQNKPKKDMESEGEMEVTLDDNAVDFKSSFLSDISQLFQGDKTAVDVLVHPSTNSSGQKRRVMNPKGSQKGGTSKKRVLGLCTRCQKPVTAGGRQMHVFFHMGKDHQTYRFRCNFPDCDAEHYRKDQMEAHMVKVHGGIRPELIEDRAPELNEQAQALSLELLGTSTNAPGPSAEAAQRIYDQQMQEQLDRDDLRSRKKPKLMSSGSSVPDTPKESPEHADNDEEESASTSVLVGKKEQIDGDNTDQMIECQICNKSLISRIRGFHILWHMAKDLGISRYACKHCDFSHDRSQAVQRHAKVKHGEDNGAVMDKIGQHEQEIKMMSQKCFGIDALFARDSKKRGGKFPLMTNESPSKENFLDGMEDFAENGDLVAGHNDLDHEAGIEEETGEEPGSESGNSESQNDSDSEDIA